MEKKKKDPDSKQQNIKQSFFVGMKSKWRIFSEVST